MPETVARDKPFGVALLEVLGVLSGLLTMMVGLLLILDRNDEQLLSSTLHTSNQVLAAGIVALAVGALHALLAFALGQGSRAVRLLYAVIATLNLASGLWALVALNGEQRYAGAGAMVGALLVLYLLFNERSDAYFEGR